LLGSAALKGGKFHPKLNIYDRPIAHKYRKGKVKRTLKRESKVLETAKSQRIRTTGSGCFLSWDFSYMVFLWAFGSFKISAAEVTVYEAQVYAIVNCHREYEFRKGRVVTRLAWDP